jgi:hypothetical protein
VHTGFEWELKGRRLLRRPRHIWESKIKMALKEIVREVMDRYNLAQKMASGRFL